MATYIEPKTDWEPNDYITPQDYNRIKNNLVYLNDMFNEQYPNPYAFNPGADIGVDEWFKASKWNMFEECVEKFQRTGFIYTFGERSYYKDNGHLPNYNQLNRLEKCIEAYQRISIPVESVEILPSGNVTVIIGQTTQLTAHVLPENATDKTVTWSIESGSEHASIDQNGLLTGISLGNVTVKLMSNMDNTKVTTKTVLVDIIHVSSIQILPADASAVNVGDTLQLTANVLPNDATDPSVTWSIESGSEHATITQTGLLTGISEGNIVVKVTSNSDNDITATKNIAVNVVHVTSVTLSQSSLIIGRSSTATLTATVLPANATNKSVTWSSSDTSVATVSNGVVTSLSTSGTCTITVTTTDGNKTATCSVNVIIQSTGTYYTYPTDGRLPLDFILVQHNRYAQGGEAPSDILMSKYVLNSPTSYSPRNNILYKNSAMDTKLRSIYSTNFSSMFKERLEEFTNGFEFMVASVMSSTVTQWTAEGLPICASSAFDLGILNENDCEVENQNGTLVPIYSECTYLQQYPNLRETKAYPSSNYNQLFFLSTMGINANGSKTIYRYDEGEDLYLMRDNATIASQYFRISVVIDPNAKVYRTPQSDGAYVLDFNELSTSIAIKDLPLGTTIRDVPYEF